MLTDPYEVMVHTIRRKPAYDLIERHPWFTGRQVFVSYKSRKWKLQREKGQYFIETFEELTKTHARVVRTRACMVCGEAFIIGENGTRKTCSPACEGTAKSLGQKRAVIARLKKKVERMEAELDAK